MNLFIISALLIGLTSIFLGIFVLSKSKDSKINKIWAIFCFSVAIWGFGGYMVALAGLASQGLFWWRVTYIGINFIPVLFYHFVYLYLGSKNRGMLYLFYLYGFFFSILEWTPWASLFYGIENISLLFNSLYWVFPPTPLFIFYVLFWYFAVIFSHYQLIRVYKNSYGFRRSQIKYFFIGMVIAFIGGGTCFLPCFGINFYPYFNFTVPLYPVVITYAIIRHRLMDIKFVLRRYSVYLTSFFTILIVAVIVKYYSEKFFPDYSTLVDFFILMLAILTFPSIRNYFYRIANKYFFSSLYDSSEVIAGLSEKLRSTLDVKMIYNYIAQTLINAFHVKAVAILNYSKRGDEFNILYNSGFNTRGQQSFASDPELLKLYAANGETMLVEEVKRLVYQKHKPTLDLLTGLKVEGLTPLNIKDKTIGLIALGVKESGDTYNDEDLKVLKVVGAQAAIAIENALLYEEAKSFNIKLEKEVEMATRDLRKANVQLKKLDAVKSEFISIASHQLRTPLTVIKGYISMMLEGNFGKLTSEEMESLEKVFESNERLIQLVENLLNISRIESGRLQFEYSVVHLETIVDSVVEELSGNAKNKNLYLDYKKGDETLLKVRIDVEKIRQVMMNLIDNAIKYTKQGGITVKLENENNKVKIIISDTGMGIRSEDLPNLFKKFSRGRGTSLIHTEGTGLGLYVAQMMIKEHNGRIWAESAGEGRGSKFIFELPVYKETGVSRK